MEPMLLRGGTLIELDPPSAEVCDLRIDAGRIVERGHGLKGGFGERRVELDGRLVLPGFVNGHTHLYSTLSRGIPIAAGLDTFPKVLKGLWWRQDRALDPESVYLSALVGAIEAVQCGTTTLIDHHSSPDAIDGSLSQIGEACRRVGIRVITCYEVTDRNGAEGRDAGLAESRRFLRRKNDRVSGLSGAHASFTLDDATLDELVRVRDATGAGLHIHLCEDPCDDADAAARKRAGTTTGDSAVQRLDAKGLLDTSTVLGHGTHLTRADLATVRARGSWLVHNTLSNMNNRVGYVPWTGDGHGRSALGTDGITGDMFQAAKACWFKAQDARVEGFAPQDVLRLLAGSQRLASSILGIGLGQLQPGGAADVIVLDYPRPTSLNAQNLAAHLIFGLEAKHVSSVIVGGRVVVSRRQIPHLELDGIYREARAAADRMWTRYAKLS